MKRKTFANMDVLEFYKSLPFNYKETLEKEVETVKEISPDRIYPGFSNLLLHGRKVLEIGCGAGWLSNSLSLLYPIAVTGVDFNPVAIERARNVADRMKLSTTFHVEDLFLYEPKDPFDVVVSFGVLHHTNNCKAAIDHICRYCVKRKGYFVLGLYHKYGRKPFLAYFNRQKKGGATQEELYESYKRMHSGLNDETHLRSWFRDQVLHPHESQHTLKELVPILQRNGMQITSTSINYFEPIDSISALYKEEMQYEVRAQERINNSEYFPGFFIVVSQKRC